MGGSLFHDSRSLPAEGTYLSPRWRLLSSLLRLWVNETCGHFQPAAAQLADSPHVYERFVFVSAELGDVKHASLSVERGRSDADDLAV